MKTFKDWIQHVYPKSVYTLRETLFDNFDGFENKCEADQKLFKNLAVFDFESTCVKSNEQKDTNSTTRTGKHEPIWCQFPLIYYKNPFSYATKTPNN